MAVVMGVDLNDWFQQISAWSCECGRYLNASQKIHQYNTDKVLINHIHLKAAISRTNQAQLSSICVIKPNKSNMGP